MLQDGFGRIHDYLRISLVDKCNFRCLYCLPHSPFNKERFFPKPEGRLMTAEEIERIARLFVSLGVSKIRLTGGEPLIRRDAEDIIRRLSKLECELTLTTNGFFVENFVGVFKDAGIRSVNISLDSLDSSVFKKLTGRDELPKVLSAIDALLREKIHVKVNAVIMNGYNVSEVPDFVAWTKDTPIHVRFIEFMPFPGNEWSHDKLMPYKEILSTVRLLYPGIEKLSDHANDTAKKYRVQGHAGTFAFISTMSEPFCEGCNRLRLTADGKMRNCLFAKTETDLLTPFRHGNDIGPLIQSCLAGKHYKLGGHDENQWAPKHSESSERSMLAIGG